MNLLNYETICLMLNMTKMYNKWHNKYLIMTEWINNAINFNIYIDYMFMYCILYVYIYLYGDKECENQIIMKMRVWWMNTKIIMNEYSQWLIDVNMNLRWIKHTYMMNNWRYWLTNQGDDK